MLGEEQVIRDKLYRDPVHDLIALDKNSAEDATLMDLIDAPEMQRLRHIRQMGLANLAYHGAEHTRFSHSIGAMYVATRILDQLARELPIHPRTRFATRCAALLHDVGHGPLSHVFESFMGVSHESWTRRIILDPKSRINKLLRNHHASLPAEVVNIIEENARPRFLSQIISSQLDADRFDYLLRDSIMTGVKYGIYDFERLLHVLRLDSRQENIVVAPNGIQAVEKYLQARYHMYSQVYLHKTVRAGERTFGALLSRAADLAQRNQPPAQPGDCPRSGGDLDSDDPSNPVVTDPILRLSSDNPVLRLLQHPASVDLTTYCELDDHMIFAALHRWMRSSDPILSDLASRITERRLFKTLDISRVKNLKAKEKAAREAVLAAGLDPRYYLIFDSSGDVPYKPYNPLRPASAHILVEHGAPGETRTRDIHEVSEVIAGLARAAFNIKRVIFPGDGPYTELRKQMLDIFYGEDAAPGQLPL